MIANEQAQNLRNQDAFARNLVESEKASQSTLKNKDPNMSEKIQDHTQDINALKIAVDAYKAVELLGLPEGRIPLAQAVIYVARAKKSNEACCAIDAALSDISNGKDYAPPMHLRDAHYKDAAKYGFGVGYVYSHDAPDVEQQFLPDELVGTKYTR